MATLIHASKTRGSTLWQGALWDLAYPERYDVIVLCAEEIQSDEESRKAFGCKVINAPNDDSGDPFTESQAAIALQAARDIALEYSKGNRRILVSCAKGRNRSGLVMALVLHRLFGISGALAMTIIREKVPGAIGNLYFIDFLRSVPKVPAAEVAARRYRESKKV